MPADDLLNVDDDQVTAAATADPIEFCHILIFLFNQGPAATANNQQRPPANTANNNFEPSFLKDCPGQGANQGFFGLRSFSLSLKQCHSPFGCRAALSFELSSNSGLISQWLFGVRLTKKQFHQVYETAIRRSPNLSFKAVPNFVKSCKRKKLSLSWLEPWSFISIVHFSASFATLLL